MNERDKLLEEALIRTAVLKNYERELREYEESENVDTEEAFFSESHKKRMKRIFFRENTRVGAVRFLISARKTALAASVAVALFALAMLTSGGVRAAVRGVIVEWYEAFTNFHSEESAGNVESVMWRLADLPDGFTAVSVKYETGSTEALYENEDSNWIIFKTYPSGSVSIGVNNEQSEYRAVVKKGVEYHVFKPTTEDDGSVIVVWSADGYDFYLSSMLESEALLEAAFSAKPYGE